MIIGTISPVVIGLFLALILWSGAHGSLIFRTVDFLPFILPLVVVAIVWQWIYDPLFGPAEQGPRQRRARTAQSRLARGPAHCALRGPDLGHPWGGQA